MVHIHLMGVFLGKFAIFFSSPLAIDEFLWVYYADAKVICFMGQWRLFVWMHYLRFIGLIQKLLNSNNQTAPSQAFGIAEIHLQQRACW